MLHRRSLTCLLLLALPFSAAAKVDQSAPGSADFSYALPITATRDALWKTMIQPQRWWNDSHTWSGKAANLKLDAKVGGCWCERWDGNAVEHARVIGWKPKQSFRLQGVFGPLQEQALAGVFDFRIDEKDGQLSLVVNYRLAGSERAALDKVAPIVDRVLQQQLDNLKKITEAGTPR